MKKTIIYFLLIIFMGYTGCSLMNKDSRLKEVEYDEVDEDIDLEMEELTDEDDDQYSDDEDDLDVSPLEEDSDGFMDAEPEYAEEGDDYDDEENDESEEESEPEDKQEYQTDARAYDDAPDADNRMATLKRDCHIRKRPSEKSRSLTIQKDIGYRIWVESVSDRFYKVNRRNGIGFMWKHCFKKRY